MTEKKPLTVLWSTNPSNIKRLYISSAAGEFIYSLEMKELRDVTTKIFERKYLCVFFSLTKKKKIWFSRQGENKFLKEKAMGCFFYN